MEPCLGLTQGSLGQLSPISGAQGAGGEKICFPVILLAVPGRLPSCLELPGQGRALGVCRRRVLAGCSGPESCVWGPGFAFPLLSEPTKPHPLGRPDKMVSSPDIQPGDNFYVQQ